VASANHHIGKCVCHQTNNATDADNVHYDVNIMTD